MCACMYPCADPPPLHGVQDGAHGNDPDASMSEAGEESESGSEGSEGSGGDEGSESEGSSEEDEGGPGRGKQRGSSAAGPGGCKKVRQLPELLLTLNHAMLGSCCSTVQQAGHVNVDDCHAGAVGSCVCCCCITAGHSAPVSAVTDELAAPHRATCAAVN